MESVLISPSGKIVPQHHEDDMQAIRMKYKDDALFVSVVVLRDAPFGIGDEEELTVYAKNKIDFDTWDHLLVARAFDICIEQQPKPGEVYVVHSGNPRLPMTFKQFIGERIISGVPYKTWGILQTLDDDWMLLGDRILGPVNGVVVDIPVGIDKEPKVIAKVQRL